MASPALAIDRGVYVGHTSSLQRCIAHVALAISHPYVRSGEIANNNKSRQRNTTTCTKIMKQKKDKLTQTKRKRKPKGNECKKKATNKGSKRQRKKKVKKNIKKKQTKKNNNQATSCHSCQTRKLEGHRGQKASYARLASVLSSTEVIIATG